jgi:hypothetical protein
MVGSGFFVFALVLSGEMFWTGITCGAAGIGSIILALRAAN